MGVLKNRPEEIIIANNKARILLADDNESFGEIFCEYLRLFEKDGLEIIGVAKNGLDAIEMISLKSPDIVLLDILMPKLDGLGVLRKIHDMELLRKPDIIMLTAAGESETIQACLNLGALFYVEKPFDMEALINKLIQLKNTVEYC